MLNVGVDFGSTYSSVSVYNKELKVVETKALNESGITSVPTVLAVKNDKVNIGHSAKTIKKSSSSNKIYRAFKMLLAEEDEEILRQRGFGRQFTPSMATKLFIQELLSSVMNREGEEKINNLVVGVPEIWFNKLKTVDGCARLHDACQQIPFVNGKNIRVVSEPIAASAFFANNYSSLTGKSFNGELLLIDYGGGTLDITLTGISPSGKNSSDGTMEIRPIYRTGAGENQPDGQIGMAGMAYMEALLKRAIMAQIPDREVVYEAEFYKALDELERNLQNNTEDIYSIFDEFGTESKNLSQNVMERYDEDYVFSEVAYNYSPIPITYAMMAEVYDEIIRDIFDEKLDEAISFMKGKGIDCLNQNTENFKILLVGGFGNYALVRKQIEDKFRFSESDKRDKNTVRNKADREKAISMGAALISDGIVKIRNTVPFSIGVDVTDLDGNQSITFGLHYGEDVVFNKEYFQCDKNGVPIKIFAAGSFETFIINQTMEENVALRIGTKPQFKEELMKASNKPPVVVAFSLDPSNIISLHIHNYDYINDVIDPKGAVKVLSSFNELFDKGRCEPVGKVKGKTV